MAQRPNRSKRASRAATLSPTVLSCTNASNSFYSTFSTSTTLKSNRFTLQKCTNGWLASWCRWAPSADRSNRRTKASSTRWRARWAKRWKECLSKSCFTTWSTRTKWTKAAWRCLRSRSGDTWAHKEPTTNRLHPLVLEYKVSKLELSRA